ncbi:hypothetical protein [Streptomyces sp. NPDC048603]|uniref:hypothetical protein n=1 Tax=Streptomyces sp. NPDC048603 TaxID=3365577 RepID=UPI0037147EC8
MVLDKAAIEEIDAAHEAAKKERPDELVRRRHGIYIPVVGPASTAAEQLAELSISATQMTELGGELGIDFSTMMPGKRAVERLRELLASMERDLEEMRKIGADAAAENTWAVGQDADEEEREDRADLEREAQDALDQEARGVLIELFGFVDWPAVTEEDVRAARERAKEQTGGSEAGQKLLGIVQRIQEIGNDKTEFERYRSHVLFPKTSDPSMYCFGTEVFEIGGAYKKDKWVGSSGGWVTTGDSKGAPVTFYNMGDYYEIWQRDRESGRPLTLENDNLCFVEGAEPSRWNLTDGAY